MKNTFVLLSLLFLTSCIVRPANDMPSSESGSIDDILLGEGVVDEELDAEAGEADMDLLDINAKLEERRRQMEAKKAAEKSTAPPVKGIYPTAAKVPNKNGFVLSPYTQKILDVRSIPSGKLVSDPDYPKSSKKFFYIP